MSQGRARETLPRRFPRAQSCTHLTQRNKQWERETGQASCIIKEPQSKSRVNTRQHPHATICFSLSQSWQRRGQTPSLTAPHSRVAHSAPQRPYLPEVFPRPLQNHFLLVLQ